MITVNMHEKIYMNRDNIQQTVESEKHVVCTSYFKII